MSHLCIFGVMHASKFSTTHSNESHLKANFEGQLLKWWQDRTACLFLTVCSNFHNLPSTACFSTKIAYFFNGNFLARVIHCLSYRVGRTKNDICIYIWRVNVYFKKSWNYANFTWEQYNSKIHADDKLQHIHLHFAPWKHGKMKTV